MKKIFLSTLFIVGAIVIFTNTTYAASKFGCASATTNPSGSSLVGVTPINMGKLNVTAGAKRVLIASYKVESCQKLPKIPPIYDEVRPNLQKLHVGIWLKNPMDKNKNIFSNFKWEEKSSQGTSIIIKTTSTPYLDMSGKILWIAVDGFPDTLLYEGTHTFELYADIASSPTTFSGISLIPKFYYSLAYYPTIDYTRTMNISTDSKKKGISPR